VDHVRLPDGRRLDLRISGPDGGFPLVFHHGTPGAVTPIRAPCAVEGLDWMAGMGEENVAEFSAALDGEDRLRPYLLAEREQLEDATASGIVASLETLLPDVDRAVLTGEFGEDLAANFHEAMRTGVEGWLEDDMAFTRPWGFGLQEVSVPTVIWQGSADLMVPFSHGQWLAAQLPGASAHLEEGEGHLSVGLGALDRMLDELVSAGGPL